MQITRRQAGYKRVAFEKIPRQNGCIGICKRCADQPQHPCQLRHRSARRHTYCRSSAIRHQPWPSRCTGTVLISTSPRQSGSSSPRSMTPSKRAARWPHTRLCRPRAAPISRRPRHRLRRGVAQRWPAQPTAAAHRAGAAPVAAERRIAPYAPSAGRCWTRYPASRCGIGCNAVPIHASLPASIIAPHCQSAARSSATEAVAGNARIAGVGSGTRTASPG